MLPPQRTVPSVCEPKPRGSNRDGSGVTSSYPAVLYTWPSQRGSGPRWSTDRSYHVPAQRGAGAAWIVTTWGPQKIITRTTRRRLSYKWMQICKKSLVIFFKINMLLKHVVLKNSSMLFALRSYCLRDISIPDFYLRKVSQSYEVQLSQFCSSMD